MTASLGSPFPYKSKDPLSHIPLQQVTREDIPLGKHPTDRNKRLVGEEGHKVTISGATADAGHAHKQGSDNDSQTTSRQPQFGTLQTSKLIG